MTKILIIDNDLSIRFILKKVLSRYLPEAEIYSSEDGVQGLGYALILKPDIVVIDSTLPKYSGRELIDFLTSNPAFLNIPIIILSLKGFAVTDQLPSNYFRIDKDSLNFPESLINIVLKKLKPDLYGDGASNLNTRSFRIINFLAKKILNYSNVSDDDYQKLIKGNIFIKIFKSLEFLFHQILSGIYLTLFFILLGRKEKEANIDQLKKDEVNYRSKIYPALGVTFAVILFFLAQLIISVGGILSVTFLTKQIVSAASYTWDGGGSTNNWSDCDNWSTNVCPVAADTVTFNSTSTKNSTVDLGWSGTISSIVTQSGYSGTISLQRDLIVSGTLNHGSGIFTGNGQAMTASTFTFGGGTFNAPSILTVSSTFTITGTVIFNHNSGVINFNGGSATLSCNNVAFNQINFTHTTSSKTISSDCLLPLGNNPTLGSGGGITLNGTLSGTGTLNAGAFQLVMNSGSAVTGFSSGTFPNLTISGASVDFSGFSSFAAANTVTLSSGTLTLPNGADLNGALTISGGTFNAPSGVMTVASSLTISGAPTFNHNSGTISFDGTGGGTLSCNNVVFNLVSFTAPSGTKTVNSNCSLPLGNNPTATGGIALNGTLSGTGTLTKTSGQLNLNTGSSLSGFSGFIANFTSLVVAGATADFSLYTTFTANEGVSISSGTLTLPNNADLAILTISGGTFNAPAGNLYVSSHFTVSGAPTFNHNNGTIIFDGGAATLNCNSVTFNSVIISATTTSIKAVTSTCNLPLGNNPNVSRINLAGTITGSGTLNLSILGDSVFSSGASITGFTDISAGAFTITGATFNFSALNSFTTAASTSVNISSGSLTLPNSGSDLNGGLIFSGGTFTAPSGNMTIAGALTISGSPTFNHNSGTITFDGNTSVTLSCNNVSFNRVVFAHSSISKVVNSNCNLPLGVNPTIPFSISLSGTLSGTGTLTMTAGGLTVNAGGALSGFNGLNLPTFNPSGATMDFTSYTTFTISTSFLINNGANVSLPNGADMNGSLTLANSISNTGALTAPSGNITIAGNFTANPGATFNHNSGTITFDGGTATLSCNNITFNLVQFNNTARKTINSNCTLPVGNNPTIPADFHLSGTMTGSGTLTNNITGTSAIFQAAGGNFSGFNNLKFYGFTVASGSVNWSGLNKVEARGLTLNSGTTLIAPPILSLGWINTSGGGTFTHNSGSVVFDYQATANFIIGNINFYNLELKPNPVQNFFIKDGSTTSIVNNLIIKGIPAQYINLRSGNASTPTPGLQWNLTPQGNIDIDYVDVQDSNNIGIVIQAGGKNITDSGNNTGWNFNAPTITDLTVDSITSGYVKTNYPTIKFKVNESNNESSKYTIQIDETENFASPVVNFTSAYETVGEKSYKTNLLYDGNYFVRVKAEDIEGGLGEYTNSKFSIDTLAPTGTILVEKDEDGGTNDVIVILNAKDIGIGVDQMIVSENSDFSGSIYETYSTSKKLTLSNLNTLVFVKFKDKLGNESQVYSAKIDTTNNENPVSFPDGSVSEGLSIIAFKLLDSNRNPIQNLEITLVDLDKKSTTDENGIVIFEDVPLGKIKILGIYNGKEFTQEIDISSSDKVITVVIENENTNPIFIAILIGTILLLALISILLYAKLKKNSST